jgi:hypothetical protein
LCRTRIGNYSLTDANEVSQLVEEIKFRLNENLPGAN